MHGCHLFDDRGLYEWPDHGQSQISFHKKVRDGYLALSEKEPERFRVIDASLNAEQVREQIYEILDGVIDSTNRNPWWEMEMIWWTIQF